MGHHNLILGGIYLLDGALMGHLESIPGGFSHKSPQPQTRGGGGLAGLGPF